jgi:hypothetical protein
MSEGKTPQRERIDEVLAAWPATERSAVEWDEAADKVMARLDEGAAAGGVSDEDLLAAPLPATGEEVQRSAPTGKGDAPMTTATSSRQRDRANLKELAKMAEMTPAPGRASQAPAPTSGMFAEARRASQPPAEEVGEHKENSGLIHLASLAEGEGKSTGAGAGADVGVGAGATAVAAAPASAKATPVRSIAGGRAPEKKGTNWMMFGGLIAAAAVAAGALVMVRGSSPEAIAPVAATPQASAGGPVNPPATGAAKPVVAPLAATDKGVDPMSLPPVDTGAASPTPSPVAPRPTPVVAAGGGSPSPAAPAAPTAAASAAPDPALVAVVPTATAAPSSSASLQDLMQQAAGVTPSTTTPAATAPDSTGGSSPGSVPIKPSQGAVAGALGAAMPAARACLGPDDPISRATVTFQSDGSVQSVSISGWAAGKPAEGCIRSALMKARVQPFAVPTFSAPATIRPN